MHLKTHSEIKDIFFCYRNIVDVTNGIIKLVEDKAKAKAKAKVKKNYK